MTAIALPDICTLLHASADTWVRDVFTKCFHGEGSSVGWKMALRGTCRAARSAMDADQDVCVALMAQAVNFLNPGTARSVIRSLELVHTTLDKQHARLLQSFCSVMVGMKLYDVVERLLVFKTPSWIRRMAFWQRVCVNAIRTKDHRMVALLLACPHFAFSFSAEGIVDAISKHRRPRSDAWGEVCFSVRSKPVVLECLKRTLVSLRPIAPLLAKWAAAANEVVLLHNFLQYPSIQGPEECLLTHECLLWAARKGALQTVQVLVQEYYVPVSPAAALVAATYGQRDVLKWLWGLRKDWDVVMMNPDMVSEGTLDCAVFHMIRRRAVQCVEVFMTCAPLRARMFRNRRRVQMYVQYVCRHGPSAMMATLLTSPYVQVSESTVWHVLTKVYHTEHALNMVHVLSAMRPAVIRLPLPSALARRWFQSLATLSDLQSRLQALLPLFVHKTNGTGLVTCALRVAAPSPYIIKHLCASLTVDVIKAVQDAGFHDSKLALSSSVCLCLVHAGRRRRLTAGSFLLACGPFLATCATSQDTDQWSSVFSLTVAEVGAHPGIVAMALCRASASVVRRLCIALVSSTTCTYDLKRWLMVCACVSWVWPNAVQMAKVWGINVVTAIMADVMAGDGVRHHALVLKRLLDVLGALHGGGDDDDEDAQEHPPLPVNLHGYYWTMELTQGQCVDRVFEGLVKDGMQAVRQINVKDSAASQAMISLQQTAEEGDEHDGHENEEEEDDDGDDGDDGDGDGDDDDGDDDDDDDIIYVDYDEFDDVGNGSGGSGESSEGSEDGNGSDDGTVESFSTSSASTVQIQDQDG